MAGHDVGAAQRRRERRLCSRVKYERLSIAMTLAEKLRHRTQKDGASRLFTKTDDGQCGKEGRETREEFAVRHPGPPRLRWWRRGP